MHTRFSEELITQVPTPLLRVGWLDVIVLVGSLETKIKHTLTLLFLLQSLVLLILGNYSFTW